MLEGQLSQLSTEVERLFDEARGRARRELADQLNQSVRRIRQAESLDDLAATLLDAASVFCAGGAVFSVAGPIARGEKIHGVPLEMARRFDSIEIPFSAAPALASAAETRDPVVAVTTAAEVSADMVALAGHPPDGRAYIYPLVVKDKVPALLYGWGVAQVAAMEMLSQVAAAIWDALVVPETPQLVTIAAAPAPVPAPAPARASSWEELTPADQAIHLRAQRFARVQVAEMRLRDAAAVQSGRTRRDLYGALQARIDEARTIFRETYFAPCSTMVDYLHLELVRTLAHEDPDLLGKDYPGPQL